MPAVENPLIGWLNALASGAWHPWRESLAGGRQQLGTLGELAAPPTTTTTLAPEAARRQMMSAALAGMMGVAGQQREEAAAYEREPSGGWARFPAEASPDRPWRTAGGEPWWPGQMVERRNEDAPWRAWDPAQQERLDAWRAKLASAYARLDQLILEDRATIAEDGSFVWRNGELTPAEARRANADLLLLSRGWPRVHRMEAWPR